MGKIKPYYFLLMVMIISGNSFSQEMKKNNKGYSTIDFSVVIQSSHEIVWETMFMKFSEVSDYFHLAESSICPNNKRAEVGAQRVCYFDSKKKSYVKEEIIGYTPMQEIIVKVIDGSNPFEATAVSTLSVQNPGGIKVSQTLSYRTKPVIIGKLFKGKLAKDFGAALIGLKYYLETGDQVDKSKIKAIRKAYKKLNGWEKFSSRVS